MFRAFKCFICHWFRDIIICSILSWVVLIGNFVPLLGSKVSLPSVADISPLNCARFQTELKNHPDKQWVHFVLQGVREGFKLGFNPSLQLKPTNKNKVSARQHAKVIDSYLDNEVRRGRVAGPFDSPPIVPLQISSFGVIPKKGQPGKWRLIFDLSSPLGHSVNDGIDSESCSLQYVKVDDIVDMIARLGKGALLAKFDIETAYRNVPIHPSDRRLLGMKWRSKFYVDLVLPFGLRSAPYIFNTIAEAVEWILRNNYAIADILHYLDDFILAGPPGSNECAGKLSRATTVVEQLGLPLHPDKCIGPSTTMIVLGIEIDTVAETLRLPADKFTATYQLLVQWSSFKWCRRKQLQSLIGSLHHASKVVWPGRTFLRRMIDLLRCFRNDDHPIRLNSEFKKDLNWWLNFFQQWNGISFFLLPSLAPPPLVTVGSDASGTLGYGAYFGQEWFNGRWLPQQCGLSIAYKELFPVVIGAHIWGQRWKQRRILFRVDNESVVAILNSRTSKDPSIMLLLRSLLHCAAQSAFFFTAQHVPGVNNGIADALSRFRMQVFRSLAPAANKLPESIPAELVLALSPNP